MNENFSQNLRHLCNQYPSVTFVCQSMVVNRQQFNKYLNGSVYPSRFNLEKICAFFKVDSEDFDQQPEEFVETIKHGKSHRHLFLQGGEDLNQLVDSFPSSVDLLERYLGYYYCHNLSLGYPGFVNRSLVRVYKRGDRFYTTSLAHLWDKENNDTPRYRFRYWGLMLYLADRIFIMEYETPSKMAIFHTILYPRSRDKIDFLSGVTTGVGSLHTHLPMAARVDYEFLGRSIHLKSAIKGCGLIKVGSPQISKDIQDRIANNIDSTEFTLTSSG